MRRVTAEEYLVDDGWKLVETKPEAVGVNTNGHHAKGHEAIGRRATSMRY